ncbi:FMN-binding protein [soil metagenome]
MRWEWAAPNVAIVVAGVAGVIGVSTSTSAFAVQYYSVEAAQKALFPSAATFQPAALRLSAAQRDVVAERSNTRVPRNLRVHAWTAHDASGASLGSFLSDEVTGKHEMIAYAVAVSPDGHVLAIEILDYRESYGEQIRGVRWRDQFRGKTASDPLKLDKDIVNLTGATLSCSHVTEGVRRLLAIHELVLKTAR